ncbi:hypothetical protein ACU8KH_05288 [Lachancea thermotolerans]
MSSTAATLQENCRRGAGRLLYYFLLEACDAALGAQISEPAARA